MRKIFDIVFLVILSVLCSGAGRRSGVSGTDLPYMSPSGEGVSRDGGHERWNAASTDVCLSSVAVRALRHVLWWIYIFVVSGGTHYWEALDLCLHFLSALMASRWEVFLAWERLLNLFSYWNSWFDSQQLWQTKDLMFGVKLQGKHRRVIWKRRVVKVQAWNLKPGPSTTFGFHYFFLPENVKNRGEGLSHGAGRGQTKHPASSTEMKTDEEGKQV